MHHPAEKIVHTIAFVTTVVEHSLAGMRNSSLGVGGQSNDLLH